MDEDSEIIHKHVTSAVNRETKAAAADRFILIETRSRVHLRPQTRKTIRTGPLGPDRTGPDHWDRTTGTRLLGLDHCLDPDLSGPDCCLDQTNVWTRLLFGPD